MPPRPTKKLLLAAVLLTTGALLVSWVAGVEIYRWALLRNADSIAVAKVTAERLNPCAGKGCAGNGGPYQIKYEFKTPSDPGLAYVYTGQMLYMERWVRVPQRVWEPAARSKLINVLYAPRDPKINQPAYLTTPTPLNAFGLAIIALFMALVAGFYWRGHKV